MKKIAVPASVLIVIILTLFLIKEPIKNILRNQLAKNPDSCESLKSGRDRCYNGVAQMNINPNLCEKISLQSGDINSDSRDNCYGNVAEKLQDPTICQKIQKVAGDGSRNTCYLNIATASKRVELCSSLEGESTTDIGGNSAFVNKDFCIQNVAMEKLDPTVCEQVSVKEHKFTSPLRVSTQSCYAFLGQNKKDASLCDKAGELKNACLEGAAQ